MTSSSLHHRYHHLVQYLPILEPMRVIYRSKQLTNYHSPRTCINYRTVDWWGIYYLFRMGKCRIKIWLFCTWISSGQNSDVPISVLAGVGCGGYGWNVIQLGSALLPLVANGISFIVIYWLWKSSRRACRDVQLRWLGIGTLFLLIGSNPWKEMIQIGQFYSLSWDYRSHWWDFLRIVGCVSSMSVSQILILNSTEKDAQKLWKSNSYTGNHVGPSWRYKASWFGTNYGELLLPSTGPVLQSQRGLVYRVGRGVVAEY